MLLRRILAGRPWPWYVVFPAKRGWKRGEGGEGGDEGGRILATRNAVGNCMHTPGGSIREPGWSQDEVTQLYPTHHFISSCARISNNQVNRTYRCADVANSATQLLRKYDQRIIRNDKPRHVTQYTVYELLFSGNRNLKYKTLHILCFKTILVNWRF